MVQGLSRERVEVKSFYTFLISSKNRSSCSIRIRETATIQVDGEEEKEG